MILKKLILKEYSIYSQYKYNKIIENCKWSSNWKTKIKGYDVFIIFIYSKIYQKQLPEITVSPILIKNFLKELKDVTEDCRKENMSLVKILGDKERLVKPEKEIIETIKREYEEYMYNYYINLVILLNHYVNNYTQNIKLVLNVKNLLLELKNQQLFLKQIKFIQYININ